MTTTPHDQQLNNDLNETGSTALLVDGYETSEDIELNSRMKSDLINQCWTLLADDEETRLAIEANWKKTSRWLGDASMLATLFDTLPLSIRKQVAVKYQEEIRRCFNELFHCEASIVVSSAFQSDTYAQAVRYILKNNSTNNSAKTPIIYISSTFSPDMMADLRSAVGHVKFESIGGSQLFEDLIDVTQLSEAIQRDLAKDHFYPAMVIATAGTTILGHCDDLTKIKVICDQHKIWLHATGDLLGALPFLGETDKPLDISADSFTLDISRLCAVQGLPYLTFFVRKPSGENDSDVTSHPSFHWMVQNPSVGFINAWSIGQRCSNEEILRHLKYSFELMKSFYDQLSNLPKFRIIHENQNSSNPMMYKRILHSNAPEKVLPRSTIIFRFEPKNLETSGNDEESLHYIEILNLWLHDRMNDAHPKFNLELLKSPHLKSANSGANQDLSVHGIRFSPLEICFELVSTDDLTNFFTELKNLSEILAATMTSRSQLPQSCQTLKNLQAVPLSQWAGIGAIRYIPDGISLDNAQALDDTMIHQINTIQAELSRKLQHKDSAFSLGILEEEENPLYFLRLGMVKRPEDLGILLEKVAETGKEVEESLKYLEDMAEKIRVGIEKVQKDLEDENIRAINEGGILRALPLVSNLVSWWSPPDNKTPKTKGRSYDLNTGRVETTEEIYLHRMQIQKAPVAETHSDHATPSLPPSNE